MDMSDPQTAVYIQLMQKKAVSEIGTAASAAALIVPGGVIGTAAGVL